MMRSLTIGLLVASLLGSAPPEPQPASQPAPAELKKQREFKRLRLRNRRLRQQRRQVTGAGQRAPAKPKGLERCQEGLPQLQDRLPFGPGEELGFVITMAGVYVGRVHLQIGERSALDSAVIYPTHALATTNSFFRKMSKVESRMTSFITPDGVVPLSMFSRSESDMGVRLEEASFDTAARTAQASLQYNDRQWNGRVESGLPLQDAVSIVYFARSRQVEIGRAYCTELYYGKRRWLVRGKVEGLESVSTPAGPYRAFRVSGLAVREGSPAYQRGFTVWIADDEDRLPVRLTSPGGLGEIEVTVEHFKRGRRLVKKRERVGAG